MLIFSLEKNSTNVHKNTFQDEDHEIYYTFFLKVMKREDELLTNPGAKNS